MAYRLFQATRNNPTTVSTFFSSLSKRQFQSISGAIRGSKLTNMQTSFDKPVLAAVIGGTGLYKLDGLKPIAVLDMDTPWGKPSSPVTIALTPSGDPVAFISRHGKHHEYTPTGVPAQANIAALKKLGVKAIISFSAVGSLQEEIRPRDFVVVNQIFDRTRGVRPSTYFGEGFVGHAMFGEPFDLKLNNFVSSFAHIMEGEFEGEPSKLHTKKASGKDLTVVCMEGPAFSTRAESQFNHRNGFSVINMSVLPEAKLAREAEISYQMICMSTDYDAWREAEEVVTVEQVMGHVKANGHNAERFCEFLLDPLVAKIKAGEIGHDLEDSMKYSVSTNPNGRSSEMTAKLEYLFPGRW